MTHGLDGLEGSVSRETLERLERLSAHIQKWSRKINLVSKRDSDNLWHRHIVDSAQLWMYAPPNARHWVDIGSGGGLPGLVIAILAAERHPDLHLTLIESDQRKATFLSLFSREENLPVEVICDRIETVPPRGADILSARALASVDVLLGYVDRHLAPGGVALLPKGRNYTAELDAARKLWHFDMAEHPSATAPDACILEIRNVRRA